MTYVSEIKHLYMTHTFVLELYFESSLSPFYFSEVFGVLSSSGAQMEEGIAMSYHPFSHFFLPLRANLNII